MPSPTEIVETVTHVLRGIENGTSVSGYVENKTFGIIYSSITERVLSLLFVGLSTVYTLCAQLLVLVTIIKSPKLHNAHFYLLGAYCCVDITLVALSGPSITVRLSDGEVPLPVCLVVASIAITCVLGLAAHTAVIAYERYVFFCHPYQYLHRFKVWHLGAALVICYAIPATIVIRQEVTVGRTFHAASLSCSVANTGVNNMIMFLLTLLPSAIVTMYCMIRVWKLTRSAAVGPVAVQGNQQNSCSSSPVQQAKKTLKMMLHLSGTFWATTLPVSVLRISIYMNGYTWDDLDSRRYIGPAIMMRLAIFIYCFISSAVNPLIYYYSRKDLRQATRKLLHMKTHNVHPEVNELN